MQTEMQARRRSAASELLPLSEHQEYCERAFAAARSAGKSLVRLTLPAPLAPVLAHPGGSMLWSPPEGAQLVGSGQAATVVGGGATRFAQIKEQAAVLWATLHDAPHASARPTQARLFGGLSFADGDLGAPWTAFGQGRFWLPRMLFGREGERAWLNLCVDISSNPAEIANELYREQSRLLLASEAAPRQAQIDRAEHLPPELWHERIEAIRSAIDSGAVHKVVAARSSRLHFREGIELRPALERLSERYPDCFCYAFQCGDATFVGASPETLIDKRGLQVSTQAMAGSIAADHPDADRQLLGSKKDRLEQDLVVQAIAGALRPLCSELHYEETPETRTLRHLSHLCTPIRGKLEQNRHVLDLVSALHPTPAVGGSPLSEALRWIADTEDDRGWYAAPVGWFDADGDGRFAVAIRSALFTGKEALVYAGAGIVADSDPSLEYQETGLKQRAILDALGILG